MVSIHNRKGMTLIEVILAFAILSIILIAFLTMFTSSFIWINSAGDLAKAYSKSQEDIETRLATGEAISSEDLVVKFDGTSYSIKGGLIDTDQTVRKRNSRLEMFVPYVPTIVINPRVQFEGEGKFSIGITGIDTNFNSSTIVEIFDKSGNNKMFSTLSPNVLSMTSANFDMPSGIVNDDYVVKVITSIDSSSEIARTKFTVVQPKFIAVGDNSIYISANGINWVNRSELNGFPTISGSNSIISNGKQYVAVGDKGLVLTSQEMKSWTIKNITTENLVGVAWAINLNKFFAMGDNGNIFSSSNGLNWSKAGPITTSKLNKIATASFISGDSILIAVGDNGIVMTSVNGSSWTEINVGTINIKAIVSGYLDLSDIIVAVGENGMITNSSDGIIWSEPKSVTSHNFNDITYNQGQSIFVAVGENGLIMTSTDGINWVNRTAGTENLNGVFALGNSFITVGDNGTILCSTDGIIWTNSSSGITEKLNSVSGK